MIVVIVKMLVTWSKMLTGFLSSYTFGNIYHFFSKEINASYKKCFELV